MAWLSADEIATFKREGIVIPRFRLPAPRIEVLRGRSTG